MNTVIPIFQTNPNISRGPKNSAEFIKMCEDIHYDLSSLFAVANAHDTLISRNMDSLILQNYFLQHRIKSLNTQLTAIKTDLAQSYNNPYKLVTAGLGFDQNALLGQAGMTVLQHDMVHDVFELPHNAISKVFLKDSHGTLYVSPELKVTVYFSADNVVYDIYNTTDTNNMFDGSNSSFWLGSLCYDNATNIDEVYINVLVDIPQHLTNNSYINSVSINSFPEYSMDLIGARYYDPNTGTITMLPNFPEHGVSLISKQLLSFGNLSTTKMLFTFKQPHYFLNNNQRHFYFGFQEIDISFSDYTASCAYGLSKLTAPKVLRTIEEISVDMPATTAANISGAIKHTILVPTSSDDILSASEISTTSTVGLGDTISGGHQSVYILTEVTGSGGVWPVIHGINARYTMV